MKNFLISRFHQLKHGRNHWARKIAGVSLVIFGLAGFLPVLGFWMVPLGLALLAVDFPVIRRFNRRLLAGWEWLRWKTTGRAPAKFDRPEPDRSAAGIRDKDNGPSRR